MRNSKGVVDGVGALMFILGLSGMADAITGQGSFMVSVIVFAIGFGICLDLNASNTLESIKRFLKKGRRTENE